MARETRRNVAPAQSADLFALIDRLTELGSDARRVPIRGRIMIDEQEFFDTLDLMRQSIPDEIQQARRVVQERQQIMVEAHAEAEQVLNVAKERAAYMISDRGLMAEARARGEDVMRQSREQTRRTMTEIDAYALKVLEKIETAIRDGLEEIDQAKQLIHQPGSRSDV